MAVHPLHTSVAELVPDPGTRSVQVTVRVYLDDFGTAVPGAADSATSAYVRSTLTLADPAGRPVALQYVGAARAGAVVRISLRAELPGGLPGVRVRNALLWERFPDQVNIVRATYGGRTASRLFTPGTRRRPCRDRPRCLWDGRPAV